MNIATTRNPIVIATKISINGPIKVLASEPRNRIRPSSNSQALRIASLNESLVSPHRTIGTIEAGSLGVDAINSASGVPAEVPSASQAET